MSDRIVEAVIEVPRGSQNKYEMDKTTGRIVLDRVLYSPMFYPGEYGYLEGTLSEDGDPLDVLVLSTCPTFPGCRVPVRVVGLLRMADEKGLDEKILGVVAVDPRWDGVQTLEDVPEHIRKEIAHFFQRYKELEGKEVQVHGWDGPEAAMKMIAEARERYARQQAGGK